MTGTNYHGWQIQNNGITIESEIEPVSDRSAARDLLRSSVPAGQIPGVHALGIAVFDTTSRMPAEKISYALNQETSEGYPVSRSPNRWKMTGIPEMRQPQDL